MTTTLPGATLSLSNGNLGRVTPSADGVSVIIGTGIAVVDEFALGDIVGPFFSLDDAEAKGITEAYDTANKVLLWHHIKDFYEFGALGTELYVMPLGDAVTMEEMADKTEGYAALITRTFEHVKLISISRVPPVGYSPDAVDGFDPDVWAAVTKAQAFVEDEFTKYRYIDVYVEGRSFTGTIGDIKDLRSKTSGLDANMVSVVASADNDVSLLDTQFLKYANVCAQMGDAAANPVQRNTGRVKNGKKPITNPGLSNGALLSTFNKDTDYEVLNARGYIFLRTIPKKAGYFWNDDHCACPIDDDFAYKSHGRTIHKAALLVIENYVEEINDDIFVDEATGNLPIDVVKDLQQVCTAHVRDNMSGEISGVGVYINPEQNFLSTDEIAIQVDIVKKGTSRHLKITLGFKNPANA